MKQIAILGSTGSIGQSTLKVIRHLREQFKVVALAAYESIDLLERQALEFEPAVIGVYNLEKAYELQKRLPHIKVIGGMEGLLAASTSPETEMVVSAIAGTLGLQPTLAAIEAGKDIGLANKEALVSGGALIMRLVAEKGVQLIPLDSEHSAIFQCLKGESKAEVEKIILTSSGGPFRTWTEKELDRVDVGQALQHPRWKMGPKITIDSSTLMNKGLEVIEAYWLFNLPVDKIEVIIHPQSIIHSLVEFIDHSLLAQMGETDMVIPIQYALTYPKRQPGLLKPFDFLRYNTLQFFSPDKCRFPCLRLAFEAIENGGSLPCYMNAANEVLVQRFLRREIAWKEIGILLEELMLKHSSVPVDSLETILAIDQLARVQASQCKSDDMLYKVKLL